MTIPHWETTPAAWDTLVLGTHTLPGVWTVRGTARRSIDVKKVRGQDYARLKDEGYESTRLTLTGRFIDAVSWLAMQAILPQIHPRKKGGLRDPLGIFHPAAAFLGISNVYVDEIDTPEVDNGIVTLRISAIEWVPVPKKAKAKTTASVTPSDFSRFEAPTVLNKVGAIAP